MFTQQPDGLGLATADVVDCEDHIDDEGLSSLAALGDDYAALEMDLLEVIVLMIDLPEFPEERRDYVLGDFAFLNVSCHEGTLIFSVVCAIDAPTRTLYQDAAFEATPRV